MSAMMHLVTHLKEKEELELTRGITEKGIFENANEYDNILNTGLKVVKLLIRHKADVNVGNFQKHTPMHMAAAINYDGRALKLMKVSKRPTFSRLFLSKEIISN